MADDIERAVLDRGVSVMSRPPELAAMVDALAEALGSGCPKGCMQNAVMCRTFSPDFLFSIEEDLNAALRRAQQNPCQCWCHSITFKVRPGVSYG